MTEWWKSAVIYQIYPRSFMDGNGDGIGDLRGVVTRLDYLQWLGIDAIWFSPIFPSPMADFGYDVSDYKGIHPFYGTLDDFDNLLEQAHRRNIRIILDLVPNHTSSQHPWFLESRLSRDNPKRDWYIWKDPKPDGSPPNNWMSYFGGPAWTFDEHSGQYYLHNFDPAQPELNWRNLEVEEAIFDVIRFWLSRGVDGFRIDVVDRILKDEEFRDNPINPDWQEGGLPHHRFLRVYSEQAPGTHDYMKKIRNVFDEFPGTVSIGEVAYGLPFDALVAYHGAESGDELHIPFNFGLTMQPWNAHAIRAYIDAYDAAIPEYGFPNYVLGNHDIPRLATKFSKQQLRNAALLLLSLRGTPTLYYGDEIGMEDVYIPQDQALDPQGKNGGYNRDSVRTPMQWDDSPNAGFCPPDASPWLPLSPDYEVINVAAQRDDPNSILSFYRRLLALRRQNPALNLGRYASLDAPIGCFVYLREHDNNRFLIALNFSHEAQFISMNGENGIIRLSTHAARADEKVEMHHFLLKADEGVIIELT